MTDHVRQNFHITTSGFCHTPMRQAVLAEVGADRVMFPVDYRDEDMAAADWFANTPLSPGDRTRLGRSNAERLFGF